MHRLVSPLLLSLCLLAAGCPTEEPGSPAASVAITGAHGVQIGTTTQLVAATVSGEDAGYTWSSADPQIATVGPTGIVTGVAAGEVDVSAQGDDTLAVGSHAVVVVAGSVEGEPSVRVAGPYYMLIGESATLVATTVQGTDSGYSWQTDDPSVATVDDDGVLRGVLAGTVVVTATGNDTGLSGELGVTVSTEVPHLDEWSRSAHAAVDAEAFQHWNEDGAIPTSCARCHSTPGFLDYVGADGSAAGVVDAEAPTGTVVTCAACHAPESEALDSVTFPSGVTVEGLGSEARCMTCHQGRSSTDSVDAAIADAAAATDDTVSPDLGFVNIHYYAAGATLLAGVARGGYQYDGEVYDVRFRHVDAANTCVECHSPHSLEVQVDACGTCHEGVATPEDLKDVRMMASSTVDYDGDGDLSEGVYYEVEGVRDAAMAALLAYATDQGNPVCYDPVAYPYFFHDTTVDGACDAAEATYGNRYTSWTPRMLRGAYNIQVASKDPGAFAHNAKYIIELLYDSATDLNSAHSAPADLSSLERNDPGHFNGSGQAARRWDSSDAVSASCSTCHGASEGLRFFLDYGVGLAVLEQGNGLDCESCHETFGDAAPGDQYALIEVESYELASGASFSEPDHASNLCATCHSGRKTGADVDAAIARGSLSFQNVHYLPSAGVRRGGAGNIGYQYPGLAYSGQPDNHLLADGCVFCHDPVATGHSFQAADAYAAGECAPCHTAAGAVTGIRGASRPADYDGDGLAEPLAGELDTLAAAVLQRMNTLSGICYTSAAYPYFFVGAGPQCVASEANSGNRFGAWTPALLKASYNYQLWAKDPGGWAHNFDYIAQLLFDTYADLGGDPAAAGWLRPPVQ